VRILWQFLEPPGRKNKGEASVRPELSCLQGVSGSVGGGVGVFFVLGEVEADALILFWNAEAHDFINDEEQDHAADEGEECGDESGLDLNEKLFGGGVGDQRVDQAGGKEPCEKRADDAADPMDSEGIQCVVIAKLRFDHGHHEPAEDCGSHADPDGGHGGDESGGGGDGHQSGDHAGGHAQGGWFFVEVPVHQGPG